MHTLLQQQQQRLIYVVYNNVPYAIIAYEFCSTLCSYAFDSFSTVINLHTNSAVCDTLAAQIAEYALCDGYKSNNVNEQCKKALNLQYAMYA